MARKFITKFDSGAIKYVSVFKKEEMKVVYHGDFANLTQAGLMNGLFFIGAKNNLRLTENGKIEKHG